VSSSGYPNGARTTPVPDLFFSRDLVEVVDAPALRTLLVVLWRVHRRAPGTTAAVAENSVLGDSTLLAAESASGGSGADAPAAIAAALDDLVGRGLLVEARLPSPAGPTRWLFVNNQEGRRALERCRSGDLVLPDEDLGTGHASARPNIYALYEQNLGALTPMLAEELKDAETTYPERWIEDAIRIAVENNARSWSYVRAILERWSAQGRDDGEDRPGSEEARARDSEGPYAAWVKR